MSVKSKQTEEYKKEVADISTFAGIYIPQMCNRIYNMFGFQMVEQMYADICFTAEHYNDVEKCLKQLRACFRMANMRYPLDLSVYEDTKSGRVLILQYFFEHIVRFLCEAEKEPEIKEDVEITPLKENA